MLPLEPYLRAVFVRKLIVITSIWLLLHDEPVYIVRSLSIVIFLFLLVRTCNCSKTAVLVICSFVVLPRPKITRQASVINKILFR